MLGQQLGLIDRSIHGPDVTARAAAGCNSAGTRQELGDELYLRILVQTDGSRSTEAMRREKLYVRNLQESINFGWVSGNMSTAYLPA